MSTEHESNNPVSDLDLTQFDETYAEAPIEERDSEPPDGKFQVSIEKVDLTRSQAGNPILKWMLRILGPTCEGRVLWRNNVIVSRENVKWLKNDLFVCGLKLEKLSDLAQHLAELLDVKLEVTKRTQGEFTNVYFNRRIVTEDAPAAGGGLTGDIAF